MKREENNKGCIYLLRNLVNGKGYVGQHGTLTAERRWAKHIKSALLGKSLLPVHCAIRKYGVENFSAEIIWRGACTLLNAKEVHYIKKLKTFVGDLDSRGYNLTRGGGGVRGITFSTASKKQMSRSAKKRFEDPAERDKTRRGGAIRWADPGEHIKSSEAQLRSWACPLKRQRASKSAKKRFEDPAERTRSTQHLVAHWRTPKGRRRRAAIANSMWADPVYRKAMSDVHKGKKDSEETRRKKSEAGKRAWAEGKFVRRKKKGDQ